MGPSKVATIRIKLTQALIDEGKEVPPHLKVDRLHPDWEKIQLTKTERNGKTFEEMQEMRKAKWEVTSTTQS